MKTKAPYIEAEPEDGLDDGPDVDERVGALAPASST